MKVEKRKREPGYQSGIRFPLSVYNQLVVEANKTKRNITAIVIEAVNLYFEKPIKK